MENRCKSPTGPAVSGLFCLDPVDVAHLAAAPGLGLAVEMQRGAGLGGDRCIGVDLVADEIVHRRAASDERGRAGRQAADGADVLFELRGDRALDRPVAAVVDARRKLVDDRPVRRREEFDREHADVAERFGDAERRLARLGDVDGGGGSWTLAGPATLKPRKTIDAIATIAASTISTMLVSRR